MFPDVLVAAALLLALVASSWALAQTMADFVVERSGDSVTLLGSWNHSRAALACCYSVPSLALEVLSCSC